MKTRNLLLSLLAMGIASLSFAQNHERQILSSWSFRQAASTASEGIDADWYPATVPGTVHTDLMANGLIEDPYYRENEKKVQWVDKADWQYRTTFKLSPEEMQSSVILMRCYGLDTYADVYVNGHRILEADNMFRTWTMDVRPYVHEGENDLMVYLHSPITEGLKALYAYDCPLAANNDRPWDGGLKKDELVSVFVRKAPYHFGWDWGPRLVTSGIWRPISLIFSDDVRINDVWFRQDRLTREKAELTAVLDLDTAVLGENASPSDYQVNIKDKTTGKVLASAEGLAREVKFTIDEPELWWSNGLGEAHLYELEAEIVHGTTAVTHMSKNVGLRTIRLREIPDEDGGVSMYFELNGVPVFMKGANHIPNDIFLPRVTPGQYEYEIRSAADANMNMLRVWGGGIYEEDLFYDLCDRYGILIWQDFMFACSMYPGTDEFLKSIEAEAADNLKRLRNHPCLAFWCGNNEIDIAWQEYNPEGGWGWKQKLTPEQHAQEWKAYQDIFQKVLPAAMEKYMPGMDYKHSSPIASDNEHASETTVTKGDIHSWSVWHGGAPFEFYGHTLGRFMTEYGFQSFPEMRTIRKYALPEDYDIESPVMTSHQKNMIGNRRIRSYMADYYGVPSKFEDFIYVGQVLQADGIRYAIEAHRANMPYTMGSLYWQINDCWPVASWSGMDWYQEWKALHYFAKKAYAPILATAVDKSDGKISYAVVSESLVPMKSIRLEVRLRDFSGKVLRSKVYEGELKANTSTVFDTISREELVPGTTAFRPEECFVEMTVRQGRKVLAINTFYPVRVKDMKLPEAAVQMKVRPAEDGAVLMLKSTTLVRNLFLENTVTDGFYSDNYMDLLPGRTYEIHFTPEETVSFRDYRDTFSWKCMNNL